MGFAMLRAIFRNRWVRRVGLTLLVLLLVVGLAGVNTYFGLKSKGEKHQRQVLADLDATDPGWRIEAIDAARRATLPPPEQNVIDVATKLADRFPRDQYRDWQSRLPPPDPSDTSPSAEELAHARELVALCGDLIPEARALRHLSGGVVVTLAENPVMTLLPHIDQCSRVNMLLLMDALVSAADGRPDDALDDALAVLAVARGLNGEPFIISQLVRDRMATSAVRSVEKTLRRGEPTDAKLAEVEAALAGDANTSRFAAALRGERGCMNKMADLLEKDPGEAEGLIALSDRKPPPRAVTAVAVSALLPETQARYLEMMTRAIAAAGKPHGPDRDAEFAKIEQDLKADDSLEGQALRLVFPALERFNKTDKETEILLHAGVVAVQAERHRLRTGRFPADWEFRKDGQPRLELGLVLRRLPDEHLTIYHNKPGDDSLAGDVPTNRLRIRLYDPPRGR